MNKIFKLKLSQIQPSQLYISQTKLDNILIARKSDISESLEPIPIKNLDGDLVSTDGHTRGVAWLLSGNEYADVEWEDLNLDWEAYRICVQWCKQEGITSIPDLRDRIIDHEEYEVLWLERCRIMQENLERNHSLS